MRISEFHNRYKHLFPKRAPGKPKGLRAAWKRTARGENIGRDYYTK